jgi:tripartite-type tricarboxylate transporter receptor subunit TctC
MWMEKCGFAPGFLRERPNHSPATSAQQSGPVWSRRSFALGVALAAAGASSIAFAQGTSFPSQSLRIVVPLSAGAPLDGLARRFAEQLSQVLGVPVIIDNKPGAGMTLGAAEVARARPDGYTVLMTVADPLVNGPAVVRVPYDPLKDFRPISKVTRSKSGPILLASNAVKATTLPELVRQAKAASSPISYASFGPASYPQLIMETLARESGVKFTEVPYKGSPPALQDLLGGLIDLAFTSVEAATPHVLGNRLHPIAVLDRSPVLPNVRTFADAGLKHFVFRNKLWFGLLAPSGTPDAVVQKLHGAVRTIAMDPVFIKAAGDSGHDVVANSPAEFEADLKTERSEILPLIKSLGITPN